MAEKKDDQQKQSSSLALTLTLGAAGWYVVMAAAALVVGVTLEPSQPAFSAVLACVIVLALAPIGILGVYRTIARAVGGTMDQKIDRMVKSIDTMCREQGLSEGAKRVLHRREERELLRRAIEQDIQAEDWDAAMVLVKELAERVRVPGATRKNSVTRIERVARAESQDTRGGGRAARAGRFHTGSRSGRRRMPRRRGSSGCIPESHRVDGLRERVDVSRLKRYRARSWSAGSCEAAQA